MSQTCGKRGRDPKTPQEWQEAVDSAAAARALADCKMYGLLDGGPTVNVARCDDILARGLAQGVRPSKAVGDLLVEYVLAINDDLQQRLLRGGDRKPTGNAEA